MPSAGGGKVQMIRCGIKRSIKTQRGSWHSPSRTFSLKSSFIACLSWKVWPEVFCSFRLMQCPRGEGRGPTETIPEDWAALKTSAKEMHHNSTAAKRSKRLRIQLNTWSSCTTCWWISYRKGEKEAAAVRLPIFRPTSPYFNEFHTVC